MRNNKHNHTAKDKITGKIGTTKVTRGLNTE